MDSSSLLRASAPAATTTSTSALDKAMSFLNKYKQGSGNVGTTGTASTTAMSAARRSSGAAAVTSLHSEDEDDEIDISLSSEGNTGNIVAGAKLRRTTEERPDNNGTSHDEDDMPVRDERVREVKSNAATGCIPASRSLTGVRSSARFPTAKELGIIGLSGDEELVGPKAAVSPMGWQKGHANRTSATDNAWHFNNTDNNDDTSNNRPALETARMSSLCLAVSIPGSPHSAGLRNEGLRHTDDVNEVSTIASVESEAILPLDKSRDSSQSGKRDVKGRRPRKFLSEHGGESCEEVNVEGSSSMLSPGFYHSDNSKQGGQGNVVGGSLSDRHLGHVCKGGALDNILSFKNLVAVAGHGTKPAPRSESSNVAEGGCGDAGDNGSEEDDAEEGEDHDDDDYGDDDFEELEATIESKDKELVPTKIVSNQSIQGRHEVPSGSMPYAGFVPSSVVEVGVSQECDGEETELRQGTGSYGELSQSVNSTKPIALPLDAADGNWTAGASRDPRQVWNENYIARKFDSPQVVHCGTSPAQDDALKSRKHDDDSDEKGGSGLDRIALGRADRPGGIKEAWNEKSDNELRKHKANSNCGTKGEATDNVADGNGRHYTQHHSNDEGDPDMGTAASSCATAVSRGRVQIDRSTELISQKPPPGPEGVKRVVRGETVAEVEYAYDLERGVDLRSFGTQVSKRW